MARRRRETLLRAAAASLLLAGCGSGDGGGCKPPVIDGTVFGGSGTATVSGTGTLPDGIADGLEVEILVAQGGARVGVLPDNLLGANDRVCGKSVTYTIKGLDPGTYHLSFEVFDTGSSSLDAVHEGESADEFTLSAGQSLHLDTTFQLTPPG